MPRPLCSWQLPLSIWLERYGATIHWPPVISARSRVSRFISQDAHSLLHTRAALCEIHKAPALLPRFGNADWDRYLSPVLMDATQPISGPNVLSKGLAGDKRRQKYAGLRLRRLSRKGALPRRNPSHFTWAGQRRARRGVKARGTRGCGVPQQSNIRNDILQHSTTEIRSMGLKHLQTSGAFFIVWCKWQPAALIFAQR